ncbi:MAG TPA: hypothetical protein VLT36_11465 [Candidatus Dormibacteraeota bacterium]|nr:hypothetical protein [Candidatus Dormibacteraeota bacterium]
MKGIATVLICLALTTTGALAQTNLDYWVLKVDLKLVALQGARPETNGVVAYLKPASVPVTSQTIIQWLNGKTVSALGKGFTNFDVVTTNHVPGPNTFTTNNVSYAIPTFIDVPVNFSPSSQLLIFQPLGTNNPGNLLVIRDPQSPVDYEISRYLQFGPETFDSRTDTSITAGRLDIAHDLVATIDYTNFRLAFDDQAFATNPPTGTHFEVSGVGQDRQFSLIESGQIIGHKLRRLATIDMSGTGQIADTNGFAIFRGKLRISGGRHETK